MKLPALDYACPGSVEEAVRLLANHPGEARILSGGQSLMPMLAFRVASVDLAVDLRKVPGLGGIAVGPDGVELGARVRWRDIEHEGRLAEAHPLLAEAVAHVGHYQVRNRGTVGGSLAHADPAAELPAVALVCEATIVAAGPGGERILAAADFFLGPLATALEPAEIITALRLPEWPAGRRWGFGEFARRKGDFALAGVALFWDEAEDGRIAAAHVGAFGVGDTPLRLAAAESVLVGRRPDEATFDAAAEAGADGLDPPSDIHAGADYRRALTATLLGRALRAAAGRGRG